MNDKKPEVIGVVGAGTMGRGIALAALYEDFNVILQDINSDVLQDARNYLNKFLARKNIKERLQKLRLTTDMEEFARADVIIEAALEDLNLKKQIFEKLDQVCSPETLFATNTSTLPVTAIATATKRPQMVGGMHFFNPAPVLPLVEVVKGARTDSETLEYLISLVEWLGKTPVVTKDTPGFIVNRVARPFYGEALRLLGENVADHEEIDLIVEVGAGFRMGPFQLMDLIGIDINSMAMQSMFEQTFGESRYRPHWLQMHMMQSNTLGRKTGRGFYDYIDGKPVYDRPSAPEIGKNDGVVFVSQGSWAPGLRDSCIETGYRVLESLDGEGTPIIGVSVAGRKEGLTEIIEYLDTKLAPNIPILCQCCDGSLIEIAVGMKNPSRLVGFDGIFFSFGKVVTLVPSPVLDISIRERVEKFVQSLGRIPIWINDTPGLILPRIVCMLVNEASFAVLEEVADQDTIDLAMRLGVSYPYGPIEWGQKIGYSHVVDILDYIRQEYGEDRYRVCILLRKWARMDKLSTNEQISR